MIKAYFDGKAAIWDENIAEKNMAKLDALDEWMDIDRGSTVLDVGTGTGGILNTSQAGVRLLDWVTVV